MQSSIEIKQLKEMITEYLNGKEEKLSVGHPATLQIRDMKIQN